MIQSVPEPEARAPAPEMEALQAQVAQGREREALLRGELQHRVRNLLAIVRSVFARTVGASESVDDLSDHFRGRLDAISRYESLRSIDPAGTMDLEYILREELQNFNFGDAPFISIAGPETALTLDAAQLMALALHELATNSIKFGVLGAAEGKAHLEIDWSVTGGSLSFAWREAGVPVVRAAPPRRGFGREFIEDALPFQIDARTNFELRPGGMACTINLPPATLAKRFDPVSEK